jgi:hypothetical protein
MLIFFKTSLGDRQNDILNLKLRPILCLFFFKKDESRI